MILSKHLAVAALAWLGCAVMAEAGPVERACMQSGRDAANRSLCGCIEKAAGLTLRASDERRVAQFFTDPDKAQEVWTSTSKSDDAFWERYKAFAEFARVSCQ